MMNNISRKTCIIHCSLIIIHYSLIIIHYSFLSVLFKDVQLQNNNNIITKPQRQSRFAFNVI